MQLRQLFLAGSLALFGALSAPAAAASIVYSMEEHSIKLVGDVVEITNKEGKTAKVTRDGALTIEGTEVKVMPSVRQNLSDYARAAHETATQAMNVGLEGGRIATEMVGTVLVSIFSGDDEEAFDAKAKAGERRIKKKALRLCRELRTMERAQRAVVANVAEFAPYAAVSREKIAKCEQDVMDK